MRLAIIVVDMLKGHMATQSIGSKMKGIVPRTKLLLNEARKRGILIVYANDSHLPTDPWLNYFRGCAIRGTEDAEIIDELKPQENDLVIEKRRMSAFFKTDLDQILRERDIDTVAVTGINSIACVLFTAADAASYVFETILVRDCCASHEEEFHRAVMKMYDGRPWRGILRVMASRELIDRMGGEPVS